MKAVIQRVSGASVKVNSEIVGEISQGLLLLIGIDEEDERSDADWLVQKVRRLGGIREFRVAFCYNKKNCILQRSTTKLKSVSTIQAPSS